jgi:transcriptional regulator GlxA family with amidase domain
VKGFYAQAIDISPLNPVSDSDHRDSFDQVNNYSPAKSKVLEDVVQTLSSCILTTFPGITYLSKKHSISESKLKRDFKEKYDATVFSYYRNLQMELAHKYITEKKCNKTQMASMLGFLNPSNFSVCYQKYLKNIRPSVGICNQHQN